MVEKRCGADVIVESLINNDVEYVLGIPGAKIDLLFDRIVHSKNPKSPKLVITRHEQNAVFIAAGIGRLTGRAGVVIVTSGPGASNLATGLATANTEGDPVLAIAGQVPLNDLLRASHQSMKSVEMFRPITKFAGEIQTPNNISEIMANAFEIANSDKQGVSFISLPQDVNEAEVTFESLKVIKKPILGFASEKDVELISKEIRNAKMPVILAGMRSSDDQVTAKIRKLVAQSNIPVVVTFQAAGVVSRELEKSFFGRVGLFPNQVGDKLLQQADLIITIGYDGIEYEPRNWNFNKNSRIVAIDNTAIELDYYFQPEIQLIGYVSKTLDVLCSKIEGYKISDSFQKILNNLKNELLKDKDYTQKFESKLNEPLAIISALQNHVTDDMTVSVDIGSHYIWMARYFYSYEPRHLLFSNGMQTLGVALPWAIAAALVRPKYKSVSVSGDGGFLFSSQELETAVRLNLNIVHIIWNDGYYDMVKFQEEMKYGVCSGVDLGPVDFVKYAESFGAKGLRVEKSTDLNRILDEAFKMQGPVIVDVPVNYSNNKDLGKAMLVN